MDCKAPKLSDEELKLPVKKLGFNFKKGSKTPKGKPPVIRGLYKEHSMYPVFFDERGNKRTEAEVQKILDEMKALETNNNSN